MDEKKIEQPGNVGTTKDQPEVGRPASTPSETVGTEAAQAAAESPSAESPADLIKPKGDAGPAEECLDESGSPAPDSTPEAAEAQAAVSAEELKERLEEAQGDLERDLLEFDRFENLFKKCLDVSRDFRQAVETFSSQAAGLVTSNNVLETEGLPDEVRKAIANSKSGLDLVLKMAGRLRDRVPKLDPPACPTRDQFRVPSEEEIPRDAATMSSYLKDISYENYRLLTTMRRVADDARDAFLGFLKTHFLAMVDGILDGRKHFKGVQEGLLNSHEGFRSEIEQWFGLYGKLIRESNAILDQFRIDRIDAMEGATVDYELHEPFDTVEDASLADETIHEVIRSGYRYSGPLCDSAPRVIRPAQVVVVKNKAV